MTESPPRYANHTLVPEFVAREILIRGFAELINSEAQLTELLQRFDALPQGSQDGWLRQCREALLGAFDGASHNSIRDISLGHPGPDAALPWIGVVQLGGNENVANATVGDNDVTLYERMGDPVTNPDGYRLIRHKVKSTDRTATVEVAVWTTSNELSIILHDATRYVLDRHKGDFTAAGVRDITMVVEGMTPSPDMSPRVAYVPITRIIMQYQDRYTITRDPVPTRMTHRVIYSSS